MKKCILLSLMLLLVMGFSACAQSKAKQPSQKKGDHVEVLYFHGKQRCVTCRAIEQQTRELLESQFSQQLAGKKVVFRVIDISDNANKELAKKYKVTWSSLFVVGHKGGKETAIDLTETGFSYARSNPGKFRQELQGVINRQLK